MCNVAAVLFIFVRVRVYIHTIPGVRRNADAREGRRQPEPDFEWGGEKKSYSRRTETAAAVGQRHSTGKFR